jgi:hypothetical protein
MGVKMKDLEEERVCVKFCFKLGKTATETWKMLQQAFGDECMSRSQCFEWYSRFKTGRTSIDEDPRSGQPSTSTDNVHIDAVHDLVHQNRRLTIREIAEDVGINFRSCQAFEGSRTPEETPVVDEPELGVAHDNAPAHSSFLVTNFLAKNKRPLYPSHPFLQIWLQRTFFCYLS